jgi:hypothetical protein
LIQIHDQGMFCSYFIFGWSFCAIVLNMSTDFFFDLVVQFVKQHWQSHSLETATLISKSLLIKPCNFTGVVAERTRGIRLVRHPINPKMLLLGILSTCWNLHAPCEILATHLIHQGVNLSRQEAPALSCPAGHPTHWRSSNLSKK